jgi:hypothetical protein
MIDQLYMVHGHAHISQLGGSHAKLNKERRKL